MLQTIHRPVGMLLFSEAACGTSLGELPQRFWEVLQMPILEYP